MELQSPFGNMRKLEHDKAQWKEYVGEMRETQRDKSPTLITKSINLVE